MIKMAKYRVEIRLKKPYTAVYPRKPSEGLAIEGFADSLLGGKLDKLLEVKIVEIEK